MINVIKERINVTGISKKTWDTGYPGQTISISDSFKHLIGLAPNMFVQISSTTVTGHDGLS